MINTKKKKLLLTFIVVITIVFSVAIIAFAEKTTYLSMATGGTGGTYYPIGGGMCELLNRNIPNMLATAEVTGGSMQNCIMVDNNECQLAQANASAVYLGYKGMEPFKEKTNNVSSMFNMHPSYIQFMTLKNSGIKSFKDFKGKIVNVGSPGGTTFVSAYDIMAMAGITEDDIKPAYLSFSEGVSAIKDGVIDVTVISSSVPNPAVMDLTSTRDVSFIPVDEETFTKLSLKYPYYFTGKIEKGAYKGVEEDIPCVIVWNIVICNSDLEVDLVYQMTKIWYENVDYLIKVHPICRYMTLDIATDVPIPMHPGSVKYFKEIGVIK